MEKVFEIGDKVEIVGPRYDDPKTCEKCQKGQKTKITKVPPGGLYATDIGAWYLARNLRLIEEELKIGDWVQAIGESVANDREYIGEIFVIKSITQFGNYEGSPNYKIYPVTSLRKLSLEEVQAHLAPPINIPQNQFNEKTEARLSAIEKRQDKQSTTNELIVDKLEEFMKRQDAQKKRMDFIEAIQKGEIEYMRDCKSTDNSICVSIYQGLDKSITKVFTCPIDAKEWTEKVLDSMRNKGDLKNENYV